MEISESISLWEKYIEDCKASGLSVKEWCKSKDVSVHKYYYWLHKIQELHLPEAKEQFVEISNDDNELTMVSDVPKMNLSVQWNGFSIKITDQNDIPLLADLMERLVHKC